MTKKKKYQQDFVKPTDEPRSNKQILQEKMWRTHWNYSRELAKSSNYKGIDIFKYQECINRSNRHYYNYLKIRIELYMLFLHETQTELKLFKEEHNIKDYIIEGE